MDKSVGVQLDRLMTQVIMDNRQYVEALMEAVLYCSQQGIAFWDMIRVMLHPILVILNAKHSSKAYLLFPQKIKDLPTFYHVTNLARQSSNSEYRKRSFL